MILKVGLKYKVEAVGTSKFETWTITEINGDEVTAKGDRTAYPRTFRKNNFKELDKKMAKQIISESTELALTLEDGSECYVERIDNWPAQERRGRKPKVAA